MKLLLPILLCTCLYFLPGIPVNAQQVPSRIFLMQEVNKLPLADVTVYAPDYSFVRSSDENGMVSLAGLPEGTRELVLSCVGFKSIMIHLDELSRDDRIYMTPSIGSLNEVVLNASSSRGVFHSISGLDIHLRPITNSQDILRMVPGLFIGQHAGGGKAEQIFLRGFDIDHGTDIRLTVDGMPVNMVSHAHGQGYADLHFLIPELIENVNFDKGPYAADKGNFATAGYVDFQTRQYLEKSFVKMEASQFNTYRAVTGINLLSEKARSRSQSLYMAGEISYSDGYFESPQAFNRLNGLLKYHGRAGEKTTITAYASAFTSEWNASGQIPNRAVEDGSIGWYGAIDDREGGNTSRHNLNLATLSYLSPKASWRNRIYYSRYTFELFSNFTFFLNDPINGDQIRQKEERNLLGGESSFQLEHAVAGKKAILETGLQWRTDGTRHSELSRTRNRTELLEPIMRGDINETNAALYMQERLHLSRKWEFTAGIRADQFWNRYQDQLNNSTKKAQSFMVSPKLNLRYRASEHLQLYWNNGQGLHSNDTRVAVQQAGRRVVTPALGSDLGAIIKPGKKLLLQTAFWYLWLEQEFVYVGDEGVVEAGGRTRRMGWDFALRYEIVPHLFADADLSLARPRSLGVPKEESYLPLAASFTSTGGITYRRASGLNGSLRYRFMDARPANEDNSVRTASYFIVDAVVNFTKPKWEIGLAVQNVLDRKWKETQFDTESQLQNEPMPVSEIHFTPGTPFFARFSFAYFF